MIKVCIIEDEPGIRKLLKMIIEKQDGFTVVAECGDFASAVTEFMRCRPDVVFVDVDLKGESGFECAKVLTELSPKLKVIFATAHSEYMANAFEIYAFDYLVKPFDVERVVKTLKRIRGEANFTAAEPALPHLQDEVSQPEQHSDKLLIKGKEQILLVDKKDIVFVERSDSITNIRTPEGIFTTSAGLNNIEEKLTGKEFMRCHKSYIVNVDKISQIEPYGRWTYVVKFKGVEESALMTAKSYEEIKKMFA